MLYLNSATQGNLFSSGGCQFKTNVRENAGFKTGAPDTPGPFEHGSIDPTPHQDVRFDEF